MTVDKTTKMRFSIQLDDTTAHLGSMRKAAKDEGYPFEKEDPKQLLVEDEVYSFETEEYYFDEENCEIVMYGKIKSSSGEGYISIYIPLSDIVFLDIIASGIKRLNKLKTAMETLK